MLGRIESVSTPVRVDDDGKGFSFGIKWFVRPVLYASPYPSFKFSRPLLGEPHEPPEPDGTEEIVPSPYEHEPYFGSIKAADKGEDQPFDSPFWKLGLLGPNGSTVVLPPYVHSTVDFAIDGLLTRMIR